MKTARKYGRIKAPRVRCIGHNPDAPAGKRTITAVFPTTTRGTSVSAVGSGKAGKGHAPIEEEVVRLIKECRSQEPAPADRRRALPHHRPARIGGDDRDHRPGQLLRSRLRQAEPRRAAPARGDALPRDRWNPGPSQRRPGGERACPSSWRAGTTRRSFAKRCSNLRTARASCRRGRRNSPVGVDGNSAAAKSRSTTRSAKLEIAFQSARLTDWFYCRAVEHRWSTEDGWSASIELATFQEARNLPQNLSAQDKALNDKMKAHKPSQLAQAAGCRDRRQPGRLPDQEGRRSLMAASARDQGRPSARLGRQTHRQGARRSGDGSAPLGQLRHGGERWRRRRPELFGPNAIVISPAGVDVDVILEPSGYPAPAAGASRHGAVYICTPIHAGDQVLVIIPDGDVSMVPEIVKIIPGSSDPIPTSGWPADLQERSGAHLREGRADRSPHATAARSCW
jgi:hypothetical protein